MKADFFAVIFRTYWPIVIIFTSSCGAVIS